MPIHYIGLWEVLLVISKQKGIPVNAARKNIKTYSFLWVIAVSNLFIHSISIAPLQVHYYSEAPDEARILCRSFTPKRHRQLRVKDLACPRFLRCG